jgi:hypothetical protein
MNNYEIKIMDQINKSNNKSLINLKRNTPKLKFKFRKCNECNQNRKNFDETLQICHLCFKAKTIPLSGNKAVDDFVKYTLTNHFIRDGKMEFVTYDNFKDVIFVAEGGFSKIYKANWTDGPITSWNEKKQKYNRKKNKTVVLKELNNSRTLNSKELNEVFYSLIL